MAYLLFLIAIACSIISQHPTVTGTNMASLLNYGWGLPLVYGLLCDFLKTPLHALMKKFFVFAIIIFFHVTLLVPSKSTGFELDMDVYFILISLMVTFSSYLFWYNHSSEKFILILCIILLISVPAVAFDVYTHFIAVTSIEAFEYAYDDKNSIATIILATLVICYLNFKPSKKWALWLSWSLMSALIIILFLLKSRATLLGLFFVLFWIVYKGNNKKHKLIVIGGLIAFFVILLTVPDAYTVIVDNILLGNRGGGDLNDLSSGRMVQIERGLLMFGQNPILGQGKYYVDCFPVAILASFGFIGFLIIFLFLASIGNTIIKGKNGNPICYTTFFLYVIFVLNSFFEAHAPFGPGVKCFLFWMMFGFTCADMEKKQEKI